MKEFLHVLYRFVPPYKKYLVLTVVFNILSAVLNIFSFAAIIPILQILFRTERATENVVWLEWDSGDFKEILANNANYYVHQLVGEMGYVIDAAGKPLGRTAVIAANLLRGKHKVDFTPNVDCGDNVIIINTDKAVLTGKKAEQKTYYRVSGWIGGLKETKARTMMENRSDYAMELAVKGMLPKNTLGRSCMTRLHLYKGAEHPHAAQKPEAWTLD